MAKCLLETQEHRQCFGFILDDLRTGYITMIFWNVRDNATLEIKIKNKQRVLGTV